MLRHGTYVGFFRDPPPIASSISFRSSGEIRGCTAGVSKMNQNQQIDQIKPMPPVRTTTKMKLAWWMIPYQLRAPIPYTYTIQIDVNIASKRAHSLTVACIHHAKISDHIKSTRSNNLRKKHSTQQSLNAKQNVNLVLNFYVNTLSLSSKLFQCHTYIVWVLY